MTTRPRIAIIGAGLSGLSAAHVLGAQCDVVLFDKSRGAGGRMSTRYAGDYEFDHGAQYFTVQDISFRAVIDTAIEAGMVAPWTGRALYLQSGALVQDTGRDRYVGTPRMNSLPKYLAKGLNIELGRRVSQMIQSQGKWDLDFETGERESGFDAVICTAPPAQAEHLLPENFSQMPAVTSAKMQACFALMLGVPKGQGLKLDWDSLRVNHGPVAWMAVNSAKPQRNPDVTCLVIHADPLWSEKNQDADRGWVQATLLEAASLICEDDLTDAPHIALHRWLYASVSDSPDVECLFDPVLNIAACGDWCLGGRVEGAWRSGAAAGARVLEALKA